MEKRSQGAFNPGKCHRAFGGLLVLPHNRPFSNDADPPVQFGMEPAESPEFEVFPVPQ